MQQRTQTTARPSRGSATSAFVGPAEPNFRRASEPVDVPGASAPWQAERVSSQAPFETKSAYWGDEDVEDALQFDLDERRSGDNIGPAAARAFSNAVCVPFLVDPIRLASLNKGGLEEEVQQLVKDARASRRGDLPAIAAHLRGAGLRVLELLPPRPLASTPLTTKSIDASYLLVMRPAVSELYSNEHEFVTSSQEELVVVDASLRELLTVAPATPTYARTLAVNVPELFVGTKERLTELVSRMSSAISTNFTAQGIDLPPWRRKSALLNRWSGVRVLPHVPVPAPATRPSPFSRPSYTRSDSASSTASTTSTSSSDSGSTAVSAFSAAATATVPESYVEYSSYGVAVLDVDFSNDQDRSAAVGGKRAGAACKGVAASDVVRVVGFDLASGMEPQGAAPWADEVDSLAAAFSEAVVAQRRASESSGSEASSDDSGEFVVFGVSPVSVFQDLPAAPAAPKLHPVLAAVVASGGFGSVQG